MKGLNILGFKDLLYKFLRQTESFGSKVKRFPYNRQGNFWAVLESLRFGSRGQQEQFLIDEVLQARGSGAGVLRGDFLQVKQQLDSLELVLLGIVEKEAIVDLPELASPLHAQGLHAHFASINGLGKLVEKPGPGSLTPSPGDVAPGGIDGPEDLDLALESVRLSGAFLSIVSGLGLENLRLLGAAPAIQKVPQQRQVAWATISRTYDVELAEGWRRAVDHRCSCGWRLIDLYYLRVPVKPLDLNGGIASRLEFLLASGSNDPLANFGKSLRNDLDSSFDASTHADGLGASIDPGGRLHRSVDQSPTFAVKKLHRSLGTGVVILQVAGDVPPTAQKRLRRGSVLDLHYQDHRGTKAVDRVFLSTARKSRSPRPVDNRAVLVQKIPLTYVDAYIPFTKLNFLKDPANGLLDYDTLTIWCEFKAGSTDNPIDVEGDARNNENNYNSLRLDEFDEFENIMNERDFTRR
ncbi:hypothetical protein TSAR_013444 [Trichomalopsis sarcophagae]|uniref:Uncharacterized protein n=1 Tax=Trichomalopsis sarcophagae TaxID=543379 RepID=A0A232F2L4_9HYME|nr:hypothetical protein TSAR_013444 [Trichomalopsis sarcophagae]